MKTKALLLLSALLAVTASAQLAPGVRGLATRAPKDMKIDGDLAEFKNAFCTPVNYFDANVKNRAAQFFHMWDDEAFYCGLRTLDTKPANLADDAHLWEGDAVEWYFDTRQTADFQSLAWPATPSPGAVHCYWTGLKGATVQSRFCLRPNFIEAIKKIGVEVGARRTKSGMEVEFKLPWANFPDFKPALNAVIALDAELCYSDGGPRVARYFTYGSPLGVQQPASLAKIQLVEKLEPAHWAACGPVMMPVRCDTAWNQPGRPQVTGQLALPPEHADQIGKVVFRLVGLDGATLGDFPGQIEILQAEGNFQRARAQWPVALAVPGAHQLLGIVYDKAGKELTRVAPRLVSTGMNVGY